MSRALVVLVVVSLLLVEAVAAHAASVVRTGQSPDEVSAYWSSEKMKGAVPRIKERAAKAKPGSTGPWTSLAVPLPYAGSDLANGKVFFTEGKTNYVCSGTSVSTG